MASPGKMAIVLEGKVFDLATHMPVAARISLQRVEPQPRGGYRYPVAAETVADAQGRWVLKKSPPGWHRVVIEAAGFVPRIVGYAQFDDQPVWQPYECALVRSALISGRVTDDTGKPLADVEVQLRKRCPTAAAATNRRMSIRSSPMPLATFARIKFLLEAPPSGCTGQATAAQGSDSRSRCRQPMSR